MGIVCANPAGEVEAILRHLDLLNKADDLVSIKLNPVVLKGKIPPHLPAEKTSLRDFFTYVCDTRTPPKKVRFFCMFGRPRMTFCVFFKK